MRGVLYHVCRLARHVEHDALMPCVCVCLSTGWSVLSLAVRLLFGYLWEGSRVDLRLLLGDDAFDVASPGGSFL